VLPSRQRQCRSIHRLQLITFSKIYSGLCTIDQQWIKVNIKFTAKYSVSQKRPWHFDEIIRISLYQVLEASPSIHAALWDRKQVDDNIMVKCRDAIFVFYICRSCMVTTVQPRSSFPGEVIRRWNKLLQRWPGLLMVPNGCKSRIHQSSFACRCKLNNILNLTVSWIFVAAAVATWTGRRRYCLIVTLNNTTLKILRTSLPYYMFHGLYVFLISLYLSQGVSTV